MTFVVSVLPEYMYSLSEKLVQPTNYLFSHAFNESLTIVQFAEGGRFRNSDKMWDKK